MTARPTVLALCLAAPLLLAGCDQVAQRLGLEDPGSKEAKADAEGRAVGSGCRQSGRAIEDCYAIYHWLPKASIFAGWRDMNDYMQANKLDIVEPKLPPPSSPAARRKKAAEAETAAPPTGDAKAEADGKAETRAETKPDAKDAARAPEKDAPRAAAKPAGKS